MSRKGRNWFVLALAILGLIALAALVVPSEAAPRNNCRFVPCPYPDCIPGEHTEVPPGQCCPVCVPD